MQVIQERHNIAKMVHMPAQSGSSRMLQAMRRGYTREAYDALVAHIRASIPGVSLSTDMIAGFCGESEEDHAASVDLMRTTAYEQAFMFAYSSRSNTHAARHLQVLPHPSRTQSRRVFVAAVKMTALLCLQDDVPRGVKNRRLNEIIAVFREQLAATNAQEKGRCHLVSALLVTDQYISFLYATLMDNTER